MHRSRSIDSRPPPTGKDYLACYGLFVVLLVLCYGLFLVWRETVFMAMVAIGGTGNATSALYGLVVVLIGLALFVVVMAGEPYLRKGVTRRRLGERFFKLTGPVVGIIVLGLALQQLIRLIG